MSRELSQGKILSLCLLIFGILVLMICLIYALVTPQISFGDLWFSYLIGFLFVLMGLPGTILIFKRDL